MAAEGTQVRVSGGRRDGDHGPWSSWCGQLRLRYVRSIDLKKIYREHYSAKTAPTIVDLPTRPFLMIDGSGDPNTSQEYADAIAALFPIAYGLRAEVKAATGDA